MVVIGAISTSGDLVEPLYSTIEISPASLRSTLYAAVSDFVPLKRYPF